MRKKLFFFGVFAIILLVIVYFAFIKGKSKENIVYQKQAVERGSIEALVDTTGTLNPVTIVDVGSQVSGKIKEIYVDFNSKVKAGQVIAQIDSAFFETQVNQSKANYSSSQASLEKWRIGKPLGKAPGKLESLVFLQSVPAPRLKLVYRLVYEKYFQ